MNRSIDVVIPSFRLEEETLLKIISLTAPDFFEVKYFLIADNPGIKLSPDFLKLVAEKKVNLLVNTKNLGFSKTRNKGIDLGNGEWILLLDDDVVPDSDLLIEYGKAIEAHPDSVGFVGVTYFPPPFNYVTKALNINGSTGHFQSALKKSELTWAPTANVILNRKLLGCRRFLSDLKKGGEDIELLAKNSIANNKKYTSVPTASVVHPWWNNGRRQIKRMFNYGWGSNEIIGLEPISNYSYLDFTNTVETIFLLLVSSIVVIPLTGRINTLIGLGICFIAAEMATNLIKFSILNKGFSPATAFEMMLHKNASEIGGFCYLLSKGKMQFFAKRIDISFNKVGPSSFRLNRWKIIKLLITFIGIYFIVTS